MKKTEYDFTIVDTKEGENQHDYFVKSSGCMHAWMSKIVLKLKDDAVKIIETFYILNEYDCKAEKIL